MPVNVSNPEELRGVPVTGNGGEKLGKVEDIYLDNDTGKPEWASVKTGLFGGHVSLVPMAAADWAGGELSVPFGKTQVKDAPHHDPGHEISEADERELFTYYGIPYGGDTVTATGAPGTAGTVGRDRTAEADVVGRDRTAEAGVVGRDTTSAPATAETGDSIIRSEERLRVGTEVREAGRARLRKYITTETVTQTVPVRREEVTISRQPITDADVAGVAPIGDLTEQVVEVTLHEERPVIAKETVAVERVQLGTREVVEQQTVSAEVRKENIEVEGVDDTTRNTQR